MTVLTSEGATQRKARMQERLTSAGANFSFFDGIDGSKKIPKVEVGLQRFSCNDGRVGLAQVLHCSSAVQSLA